MDPFSLVMALVIIAVTFWVLKGQYVDYSYKSRKLMSLKGKTVIITGGGSGLGKACAQSLYKSGCNIILSGRTKSTLEDVCRDLSQCTIYPNQFSRFYCMDISKNEEDINDVAKKILEDCDGKVDILIKITVP